ncbi:MAG: hypothetical protein D6738_10405, partial [Acidobacteria bacterium]
MSDRGDRDDLDLVCPLCHGRLLIDRETGTVLEATPPRKGGDIDDLLGEVQSATTRRESEFSRAFEAERRRRELLEKKFRLARERS